jgi:hypothetical protein
MGGRVGERAGASLKMRVAHFPNGLSGPPCPKRDGGRRYGAIIHSPLREVVIMFRRFHGCEASLRRFALFPFPFPKGAQSSAGKTCCMVPPAFKMPLKFLLLATSLSAGTLLTAAPALAQTAAPASAAEAPPVPTGRLPDAVIPSAYRLDLKVDPAQERFGGHVEIDAAIKAPSRFIYMHGNGLAVSKATVTIAGKSYVADWKQVDPTGVVLLTFLSRCPPERPPSPSITMPPSIRARTACSA